MTYSDLGCNHVVPFLKIFFVLYFAICVCFGNSGLKLSGGEKSKGLPEEFVAFLGERGLYVYLTLAY